MRSFPWLIAFLVVLGLATSSAFAADPWPARVGRVSVADPGAGLRPAGGAWSDAAVNEPIAAGASVRSGAQGRVEIRLAGIVVTLAPATTLDIVSLDTGAARFALTGGHISLSLDKRNAGTVEIATAGGAVKPAEPGSYAIDGETGLTAKSQPLPAPTLAAQTPATMPGAAALAGKGDWGSSKAGPVWYPKDLAADWTPFRDGSWRFLTPWGWTWIDNASWGFAPSHYGRWARIGDRWGWLPEDGKDFSPATVAFLGTPGIGLSYAGGSGPAVAWFPLAPGETYWPADKGEAPAGVVNASYQNRRFASAVPRPVFLGGKPVTGSLVGIPAARLDVAPVIPGSPQVSPPSLAPRLVAGLPHIVVTQAAPPPLLAAAPKRAPARIALDTPRLPAHRAKAPAVTHIAAVPPPHPDHPRRHLAEAHHILRQ